MILGHPAVAEVAVIGIPDSFWVEKVHAVIVLEPGATAAGEDVSASCKGKLAGYKIPKSVDLVEALPKNATGKVLKTELRARYG